VTDLHGLASFIKIRNVVDDEILRVIGLPALDAAVTFSFS